MVDAQLVLARAEQSMKHHFPQPQRELVGLDVLLPSRPDRCGRLGFRAWLRLLNRPQPRSPVAAKGGFGSRAAAATAAVVVVVRLATAE